jgi:hypothetical protein
MPHLSRRKFLWATAATHGRGLTQRLQLHPPFPTLLSPKTVARTWPPFWPSANTFKYFLDHRYTVLMVTHDIDECLFLADRLVMMTEGPAAGIGEILEIPFERPRDREQILEDPRYYDLRNHALEFLYSGNHG